LYIKAIEKEKRAAELVITKQRTCIQNKEKNRNSCRVIIANKALVHQNELKEKRLQS
jgi:hypothetical protein